MLEGYKEDMMAFMDAHPAALAEAIMLAPTDRQPYAWRAAWLINTRMEDNDARVRPAIDGLLAALPERADGHQREILRILTRMDLNDEQEGTLFNHTVAFWEDVRKKPALRWFAIRFILQMLAKYPDLEGEVKVLTQRPYLQPLSPGVRRSVERMLAKVFG